MIKKAIYKRENHEFFLAKMKEEGIEQLSEGVLYKEIKRGDSDQQPLANSIVSVHYKGELINGKEFDNSYKRNCPEAFRLTQVIDGWQIALRRMHKGDKGIIYISSEMGYGDRNCGSIPSGSTLIFEVELLSIG